MSKAELCTLPKTCSSLSLSKGTSNYLGQELESMEPPLSPSLPSSYPSLSPDHPSVTSWGLSTSHLQQLHLHSYFVVSLLHLESRGLLVPAFSAFNLYSKQQPERVTTGSKSSLVILLLKTLP